MLAWFDLPPEMHAMIRAGLLLRAQHALSLTCVACHKDAPDVTLPAAWRPLADGMGNTNSRLYKSAIEARRRAVDRMVLWTLLESPWRAWPGFESGSVGWTRDGDLICARMTWCDWLTDPSNIFDGRYLSYVRIFIKADAVLYIRCHSYFSWTLVASRMVMCDLHATYLSLSGWNAPRPAWLAEIKHRLAASVALMNK